MMGTMMMTTTASTSATLSAVSPVTSADAGIGNAASNASHTRWNRNTRALIGAPNLHSRMSASLARTFGEQRLHFFQCLSFGFRHDAPDKEPRERTHQRV